MIKIDLVTGFLGSGKTTFIKIYAKYLISIGEKVCILENDYGAINVDAAMFKDITGENLDVAMIVGGDGKEAHKRRLKTKLITLAMSGYTRVIIEPSGIFDTDELYDMLYEDPLDRMCELGNVIGIVDAESRKISDKSEYILASELADAGIILISKISGLSVDKAIEKRKYIKNIFDRFGINRNIDDIIKAKDWNDFDDDDMKKIYRSSYVRTSFVKMPIEDDNAYTSLFYFGVNLDADKLKVAVADAIRDEKLGNIYRIKGFLKIDNDKFLQINATKDAAIFSECSESQEVVIVIGENLNEEKIAKYFPTKDFKELI